MEYPMGLFTGLFIGFLMVCNLDTHASAYKAAEDACVSLGSNVRSFDVDTATCENTAEIKFNRKRND